jgi:hypothetical protein
MYSCELQAYTLGPLFYTTCLVLTMPILPTFYLIGLRFLQLLLASFQAYMALEGPPKAEYPLYEQGLYGTSPALRHSKHNFYTYEIKFELLFINNNERL